MTDSSSETFFGWALLISLITSLICLAPFVCSILHLLGLCHFQCFNNDVMWVYVALSAIAGVLSLSAIFKFFIIVICKDDMAADMKRMIYFHHKLKDPSRAKELYEIFCEER